MARSRAAGIPRQLRQCRPRQGLDRKRAQCDLDPDARGDVTSVQIAGLIARRILCYVRTGDKLVRGQRYGFIRFGSRVDVYLPTDCARRSFDRAKSAPAGVPYWHVW